MVKKVAEFTLKILLNIPKMLFFALPHRDLRLLSVNSHPLCLLFAFSYRACLSSARTSLGKFVKKRIYRGKEGDSCINRGKDFHRCNNAYSSEKIFFLTEKITKMSSRTQDIAGTSM